MTEQEIERRVERMMGHLDRVFLNGDIKWEDYDEAAHELREWAEAKLKRPRS